MSKLKTTETLTALGYRAITEPYEPYEEELFKQMEAQMAGTDFKVGLDRLNRKVIMRIKNEVKR